MAKNFSWLYFSSPKTFYPLAGKMIPVFAVLALVLTVIGLYMGLIWTPTDYKQGDSYRIIYIHVAAAWMSMFIYLVMAGYAILGLAWNVRLAEMMASALAPTGAIMAFIALWTGALWGKPTWGTYWVWDARLTSELILLFLYIGFMALESAIDDPRRASRASALLAIIGVINVPIIYFSVRWWNTLHQSMSVSPDPGAQQQMSSDMRAAMFVMVFAFWMYAIAIALARVRTLILEREKNAGWVMELLENKK